MSLPTLPTETTWGGILFLALVAMFLSSAPVGAFQTEIKDKKDLSSFELLEAGLATEKNVPPPVYWLGQGDYAKALSAQGEEGWLKDYLTGLNKVFPPLVRFESEHFVLWTPPDQTFLKDYALPSLEKAAAHFEKLFGHRPVGKVRVEIYSNKEDFSVASTLSDETLERSGAIGICKFHRLMVMSPKTLPLGYRWLDALAHEYMHMMINELTHSKAELWLHEGTARYFESSYRLDPPAFLTPDQKTKLLEALEQKKLVAFARMSPSMVYLKDQDEVSLAFAQVSHAVSVLVRDRGMPQFVKFLVSLQKMSFAQSFKSNYGMTPSKFESYWQNQLGKEKWEKSKGTMSDDVVFATPKEDDMIGADSQAQVRLGDRMRRQGLMDAALIEYEKALEVEPDNAVILLKAAKTNLALGQKDAAITQLRRAIEKNPNYVTPYLELVPLVSPEQAKPLLYEAISINPFDPRIDSYEILAEKIERH